MSVWTMWMRSGVLWVLESRFCARLRVQTERCALKTSEARTLLQNLHCRVMDDFTIRWKRFSRSTFDSSPCALLPTFPNAELMLYEIIVNNTLLASNSCTCSCNSSTFPFISVLSMTDLSDSYSFLFSSICDFAIPSCFSNSSFSCCHSADMLLVLHSSALCFHSATSLSRVDFNLAFALLSLSSSSFSFY
eukprot:TRINITY_DN17002_c0_g1_i7.p1 TRINITY_DN17002_c0_g1~~TRINITY_DN17002_c0_g1_i7.p1  ORF type:complete len:191 (+),score=4.39 TRINITY_DN17002_c0_g1_i7:575-1147(+)